MVNAEPPRLTRDQSYGERGLTLVDRVGVYLSTRQIRRHLPRRSDLAALDLGCGYRATHLHAIEPYLRLGVGIDLRVSPACRRSPRLTFLEATIESCLPTLPAEAFDVVLLISVLEHLGDSLRILEECRRVLRPGGVLLINVPTWRGKWFLELSAFGLGTSTACEMDDHKMYYDQRDLWPVLVRAGFLPSQIRLWYHKFGLNLFGVVRKPGTP